MFRLTIQGQLPDLNQIIKESKRGRGRWQPYNDIKQKHTNEIAWIAKASIKKKFKKVDIVIKWVCPNKRKDKDNIMAGTKFILDGLVLAGIIVNDGWGQVGNINHEWDIDKSNPRIEVTLKIVK